LDECAGAPKKGLELGRLYVVAPRKQRYCFLFEILMSHANPWPEVAKKHRYPVNAKRRLLEDCLWLKPVAKCPGGYGLIRAGVRTDSRRFRKRSITSSSRSYVIGHEPFKKSISPSVRNTAHISTRNIFWDPDHTVPYGTKNRPKSSLTSRHSAHGFNPGIIKINGSLSSPEGLREDGCYASQPKASNPETILYEFSRVHTARSGLKPVAKCPGGTV
jgi:hypothetical protein